MKLINIIIPFCYWLPGHGCSKDRKHNKMAAVGLPPIIAEQVESLRDRVVEIGHEILLRFVLVYLISLRQKLELLERISMRTAWFRH